MVAFYNQEDQDIYTGGDHFIPQQYYRLGNFTPTVPTTQTQQQGYGIPYTGAFTNSNFNRDNPNSGFGTWGNLDESSAKQFNIDGNIVTGYKNLNSGLYQDEEGYNLQNLGLFKDEEDAKYSGLFHNVSLKAMLKNPGIIKSFFNRQDVKKQAELQKEIDAANFDAMQEAELGRNIAEYGTGDRPNTGMNEPGAGKGQSPTGGDVAGTPFADGGRIGFFKAGLAGGDEISPGTSSKGGLRHGSGGTNDDGRTKKKLTISPFVNTVDDTPVELGAVSDTKLGRLKAMIDFRNLNKALTYGKKDDTVVNSLSDIKGLLDPSLSLNTQIGPVDVNAYKDKDIDSYGLRTNIGPVNLGYQDLNNQKRADISYANDKFNVGATTDFNNINLGATFNKGPLTVGGTIDDMGNWNTRAGLEWTFNNGGLVGIL